MQENKYPIISKLSCRPASSNNFGSGYRPVTSTINIISEFSCVYICSVQLKAYIAMSHNWVVGMLEQGRLLWEEHTVHYSMSINGNWIRAGPGLFSTTLLITISDIRHLSQCSQCDSANAALTALSSHTEHLH